MKKLRKILATISTVTLMSCVWGVNTHAEVKKNDLGVPTHIEADDQEEFLRDLQEVLKYITENLSVNNTEELKLLEDRCKEWKEYHTTQPKTNTYAEQSEYKYRFVLTKTRMTYLQSISYLYQLLRKSKINNDFLQKVWVLLVDYRTVFTKAEVPEIIFELPDVSGKYRTCCMRWNMLPKLPGDVEPRSLTESFSQEFEKLTVRIDWLNLRILDPNETSERIRSHRWLTFFREGWIPTYSKATEKQTAQKWTGPAIPNIAITKLISLSTVDRADNETVNRFFADTNRQADFARFKEQDDAGREMFTPK